MRFSRISIRRRMRRFHFGSAKQRWADWTTGSMRRLQASLLPLAISGPAG
jgi:hypothetical protein